MTTQPTDVRDRVADAVLSSPADAVVMTDVAGTIRFWGPGATRIFQFTTDEALGQSLDIIIPERQRERHWEGYRRVMQTGHSRYGAGDMLAVPALRKDGSRISVEFTVSLARDRGGRVAGAVALMRDVTERFEEMRGLRARASNPS